MPLHFFFWLLMILWLISGFIPAQPGRPWIGWAGTILQFLLFGALGWAVFGDAIKT